MAKFEPVYALKNDLDMLTNVVAESKNKFYNHADWAVGAIETLRIELTVLGAQLDRLTERVDRLEKRVMARFDIQDENINAQNTKIDKIMAHLGIQDGKINAQNTKIDKIMTHLGVQDEKIGKIMVHLGVQ